MDPNNDAVGPEPSQPQHSIQGEPAHPMDVLLKEAESLPTPKRGEIRTGTIAKITDGDVLVDIGAKSEGVIPAQELENLSPEQRAEIAVGQPIEVYVVRSSGRDGALVLSLLRAEEEQDWQEAERLRESEEAFDGVVSGYNKGGLIVKIGHLRGFLPASQVSLGRRRRARGDTPDKRWGAMVNEKIVVKVTEVDRRRNRLILSERAAAREAREVLKERLIAELQPGEVRTGQVISLADFGAFVDIGGADGLIHTSELSWKRVTHPREVLKVGDKVQVKVLSLDQERKRISLSLRELEEDPWTSKVANLTEGQLIEGTVTKLTKFGAFASLAGFEDYDIEGLVHISELSDERLGHPREVVQEGQMLTLRVIHVDRERRRIGLSLKRVDSPKYADQDWKAAMQGLSAEDKEAPEAAAAQEEMQASGEGATAEVAAVGIADEIKETASDEDEETPEAAAAQEEVQASGESATAEAATDESQEAASDVGPPQEEQPEGGGQEDAAG